MRVFVTGATGWIGFAVVKELMSSGHQVTGLTTSADGARRLQKPGAKARVGRLSQHEVLREAAAQSDGVIHTAFIHDLSHMSLKHDFACSRELSIKASFPALCESWPKPSQAQLRP